MRIISSFRDYYDSCMSYGMDKRIVYNREKRELKTKEFDWLTHWSPENKDFLGSFFDRFEPQPYKFLVGFCGKVYPGLYINSDKWKTAHIYEKIGLYSIDSFDEYVNSIYNNDALDQYYERTKKWDRPKERDVIKRSKIVGYFKYAEQYKDKYENIFQQNNTPIFVHYAEPMHFDLPITTKYREYKTIIDACLSELQFYKVFNVQQAYQEISMFVGGVLSSNENKIPKVSNNDLIEAKGFDLKYSFRKEKNR